MKKVELRIIGLSYRQNQAGSYVLVLGERKGKLKLPIIIKSDQSTLEKIQTALQSNYKARPADLGKFQVKISSDTMVNFLLSHGLSTNRYFQEFPPYDILTGLFDTDCYKIVDGVQTFRTPSSKLALEVCYRVSGEIITETYKDVPKGVLGCDWVVIW